MPNTIEKILPKHIVIIPDGNRRWAKEHGLKPWEGHAAGAKNTEELLRKALNLGIKCFSLWGSSLENLKKRPLDEPCGLEIIEPKEIVRLALVSA